MKKIVFVTLLSLILIDSTFSQNTFQGTVSCGFLAEAHSICHTTDNGVAMAGVAPNSLAPGYVTICAVKLDAQGVLSWAKTIGGLESETGNEIIQTNDGGYVIAGETISYGAGQADIYVVKLDANGNLLWTRTVGGTGDELGSSIIETDDGSLIVVGSTTTFGSGFDDVYIVKLSSGGNLEWTRTIGGGLEDAGKSIIQSNDGGFVVGGSTNSFGAGLKDFYILKLDSTGFLQWQRTIGGSNTDECSSVVHTNDGNYAFCGETYSFTAGDFDCYVVKLDSIGNLMWTKSIGGVNQEWNCKMIETHTGDLAIACYTTSFGYGSGDFYSIKLDSSGNLIWSMTVGGAGGEEAWCVAETDNGELIYAGSTNSFSLNQGDNEIFYVQFDSLGQTCGNLINNTPTLGSGGIVGNGSGSTMSTTGGLIGTGGVIQSIGVMNMVCVQVGINEISTNDNIEVYPNPGNGIFHISLNQNAVLDDYHLEIYNVMGELVKAQSLNQNRTGPDVDLTSQPDGIYFVELTLNEKVYMSKIVIQ